MSTVRVEIGVPDGHGERHGPFNEESAVCVDHVYKFGIGSVQSLVRVVPREKRIGWIKTCQRPEHICVSFFLLESSNLEFVSDW